MTVTLEEYEQAEREITLREGAIGLRVHAFVTVVVWAVLIPINVAVANGFPWSIFVVAGMAVGLLFQWFGYRRAEGDIRRRQGRVEAHAARHAG
jgi:hypothetical protein